MYEFGLNEKILATAKIGDINNLTVLLALADKSQALINLNDPLSWAVHNGHEAAVIKSLEHGANVNAKDGTTNTPLHWAYHEGHLKICQLLINAGADKNALNRNNITPARLGEIRSGKRKHYTKLYEAQENSPTKVSLSENIFSSLNRRAKSPESEAEVSPPDASRKRIPSSPNIG